MAVVKSLIVNDDILMILKLTGDERKRLAGSRYVLVFPADGELPETLTVGKLGNSNRVMVPKKLMKKYGISSLPRKAPAGLFESGGEKFLVVRLQESGRVPKFAEKEER